MSVGHGRGSSVRSGNSQISTARQARSERSQSRNANIRNSILSCRLAERTQIFLMISSSEEDSKIAVSVGSSCLSQIDTN
jgi:hypothetical protein